MKRITFFIFALVLQTVANISTDGLIAYLPFNGNVHDCSGNSVCLQVSGASLTTDRFGRENNAYYFDGIDDNIIGHSNPSLKLKCHRTISVWVQSHSKIPVSQGIIGYLGNEGHRGYMISIRGNGQFTNFEDNYDGVEGWWDHAHSDSAYSGDHEWHHIVGLKRNDTTYLYVDGVKQERVSVRTPIFSDSSNILIGQAKVTRFQQFTGKIDDIRVYNRSLSETEISALFDEGLVTPIKVKKVPLKLNMEVHSNILTYELKNRASVDIKCFNLQGKVMYTYHRTENAGTYSIKMPLTKGTYLIRLSTDNKILVRKTNV